LNAHFEAFLPTNLTWTQLQKGLCAVISLWHPNPQFESPTKLILMNPEVSDGTVKIIQTHLRTALKQLTPQERDEWGRYLKAKQSDTKPD
jgi:DNA gyrase/topoisomerase IV subunit B